jgi:hypothetical protein
MGNHQNDVKQRLEVITMRNFLTALWRKRFRGSHGTAQEANASHHVHVGPCQCDKFTGKPQHYSPEGRWRLLAHIGRTGPTAKVDRMQDAELDEDTLERIDFLACLFGTGKRE